MTHEIAKKLKDAGFEQEGLGLLMNGNVYALGFSEPTGDMYYPTLSELIEACGHYFYQLTKEDNGSWTCASINGYPKSGFGVTNSSTPEEAVANLWLALNDKK